MLRLIYTGLHISGVRRPIDELDPENKPDSDPGIWGIKKMDIKITDTQKNYSKLDKTY